MLETHPVQNDEFHPLLARLYGWSESDLAIVMPQLVAPCVVRDGETALGAAALRASPAHGFELLGGAFPGARHVECATLLIRAALQHHAQLYAYAEPHLFPAVALEANGLVETSAATQMTGLIPTEQPEVPAGYQVLSFTEITDRKTRIAAQRTYSHRIGHTAVPDAAGEKDFAGSDDSLNQIALDERGNAVGICRVWLNNDESVMGTPGIHPEARDSGLRRVLLLSACQAARGAGATRLTLDAWGDTAEEREADEQLGLKIQTFTPIFATPN
jgi:hypothetical protein